MATTLKSWLFSDTSVWSTGVVPTVWVQTTISHPWTNLFASNNQYRTNTAWYAIGATSITLTTGTGTIVANECVQFFNQIGVGEDNLPIYDNTYYLVTTGITWPWTIVISPWLNVAIPASAIRVVNRGHVVEVDGTFVCGNDTTTPATPASNGISVYGTLKASRTVDSSLTCRGSLMIAWSGTFDYGCEWDDVLVNATIITNDSATLSAGKHGIMKYNQSFNVTVKIQWKYRERNTSLTSPTLAGATSITVADSTGWEIWDLLVIASDTDDEVYVQTTTITGWSSPTWTVWAITRARPSGTLVWNLKSNVTVKALNPTYGSFMFFQSTTGDTESNVTIRNLGLIDMMTVSVFSGSRPANWWFGLAWIETRWHIAKHGATYCTTSVGTSKNWLWVGLASKEPHLFENWAIYSTGSNRSWLYTADGTTSIFRDIVLYGSSQLLASNYEAGAGNVLFENVKSWSTGSSVSIGTAIKTVFNNCHIRSLYYIFSLGWVGKMQMNNSILNCPNLMIWGISTSPQAEINNTTFNGALLTANIINPTAKTANVVMTIVNGIVSDNRNVNYWREVTTDTSVRKFSSYSAKMKPEVANIAIPYAFTIPCTNGVAQKIKGALRFDTNYGVATPPIITLEGNGVSETFTCTATANAWSDFEFNFTPTGTGTIDVTVTIQSTSTSGFAWLDGILNYPLIQKVRHYGYLFVSIPSQTANPYIVEMDSAIVATYPISVDHTTNTVTITGAVTSTNIRDYLYYDLCQPANIEETDYITNNPSGFDIGDYSIVNNDTFTGTLTITTTGTYTGTGTYGDNTIEASNGTFTAINVSGLVANSRVRVNNETDNIELYNAIVTGTSVKIPVTWTADKLLDLRVTNVQGLTAYLPYQSANNLTSSGASFLVSQTLDTVYNDIAIDGSSVTKFSTDYPNLQIDFSTWGTVTWQEMYAWYRYQEDGAQGIIYYFNACESDDGVNFKINTNVVDLMMDNTSGANIQVVWGYLYRDDGTNWVYPLTANSIIPFYDRAYVASWGGWWGASWNDLIADNSSITWSFGAKFAEYGWVSHVIDRSSFDKESADRISNIEEELKNAKDSLIAAIKAIKVDAPTIVSEGKTTVIKYNDAQQTFIQEFITETIPELADKIDNLLPLLKDYEAIIAHLEQKELEYEQLISDIITNK